MPTQREKNDEIKRRQKELRAEGVRMSFHATKRLLATEKRLAVAIEQKAPVKDEPNPFDEKIQLKLEQARPSFLSDGLGLRGPQNPVTNLSIDGADGRGRDMQIRREPAPGGGGGAATTEAADFNLTLTNTGSGVDLASLSGGDSLSVVRVRNTASVTAAIVTGALELTAVPLEGEGVYVDSLGAGLPIVTDSSGGLVDTVSAVSINTTFDKAIAVGSTGGELEFEWFYSNTSEGSGYLNVVKEIHATRGADFRAIIEDHGKGVTFALDGDNIAGSLTEMPAFTFKGNPSGATADPVDMTGTQATALLDEFTSALNGLAPLSGGGTDNFLRADGQWVEPPAGDGITQLIGDVTTPIDSSGNGVVASISAGAVGTPELADDAVTLAKLDGSTASTGDLFMFNGTDWQLVQYEELVVQMKLEDDTCIIRTILVKV